MLNSLNLSKMSDFRSLKYKYRIKLNKICLGLAAPTLSPWDTAYLVFTPPRTLHRLLLLPPSNTGWQVRCLVKTLWSILSSSWWNKIRLHLNLTKMEKTAFLVKDLNAVNMTIQTFSKMGGTLCSHSLLSSHK